jgi:hypothetical protein
VLCPVGHFGNMLLLYCNGSPGLLNFQLWPRDARGRSENLSSKHNRVEGRRVIIWNGLEYDSDINILQFVRQ